MTTYEEKLKELGIDRQAITRVCADPVNNAIGKEPIYLSENIGVRIQPAGMVREDLSHLVSERGRASARLNRAWWNSLTDEQKRAHAKRKKAKS